MSVYVGIDNGTSGSIALICDENQSPAAYFVPTPKRTEQSWTIKKQNISRIDVEALRSLFTEWFLRYSVTVYKPRVILEKPYSNPSGSWAVVGGARALEATLIVLEEFSLSYQYATSGNWQKVMLPKGCKGRAELKAASVDIGCRLWPELEKEIRKQKDADSLLMAEWARRTKL